MGKELGRELGVSPVTATVLINRGYDSVEKAERFLTGDLSQLHDPFLLAGMERAVDRLVRAVQTGERILVYGDYDVDGVTGTVLLTRVLRGLGAEVDWYLPHRVREGYGVSTHALEEAVHSGVRLILTTDCGIGAVREVTRMGDLGVDVIVTDHHEPPDTLPPALAVLNPKLRGSAYPFSQLAGVGVAFKLMSALARKLQKSEAALQHHFLDLVALGTIADVVPLVEENRLLARAGLGLLPKTRKVGLQALLEVTGLRDRRLTAYHVAFGLAPRLNAAGRLEHARAAVELLLTSDKEQADDLAAHLDTTNRERQQLEKEALAQAVEMVRARVDLKRERGLVLAAREWHEGIVGIVASRLVERYHRPTFLIALRDGISKGSGRSIAGFPLIDAVRECREWLEGFGGHEQAAGVTIAPNKVTGFRKAFQEACAKRLEPKDLIPETRVECLVSADDLTYTLAEELERLAPFGMENPRPVLAFQRAVITRSRPVGREGEHLSFTVKLDDHPIDCIWWRHGYLADTFPEGQRLDACFTVSINDYGGFRRVQLTLKDARPR